MKHIFILCTYLLCLTLAGCDSSRNPPFELELIEPDWTLLGNGEWSPWITNEQGNQVWNPSQSFNRWIDSIPESDKAWPILVDVSFEYLELFRHRLIGATPSSSSEDRDNNDERDWDQLADLFSSIEMDPIVSKLNAAISKQYIGEPMAIRQLLGLSPQEKRDVLLHPEIDPNANLSLYHCVSSSGSMLSNTHAILTSYSVFLAETNRLDACIEQMILIFESYSLFAERPNKWSLVFTTSSQKQALHALRWVIYEHGNKLTENQLERLDKAVEQSSISEFNIIEDQLVFHDIIRRMHSYSKSRQSSDRLLEKFEDTTPLSTAYKDLNNATRDTLALFDIPVRALKINIQADPLNSLWPRWFVNLDSYSNLDYPITDLDKEILDLTIPRIGRINVREIGIQSYRDAMRLVIAAHRHKIRHHQFPESIDAIDSDLLTIVTVDPYTGQPLHYRLTDELGPMVYALGGDEDDDLGKHNGQVHFYVRPIDGDFVYYPNPWATQEHLDDE